MTTHQYVPVISRNQNRIIFFFLFSFFQFLCIFPHSHCIGQATTQHSPCLFSFVLVNLYRQFISVILHSASSAEYTTEKKVQQEKREKNQSDDRIKENNLLFLLNEIWMFIRFPAFSRLSIFALPQSPISFSVSLSLPAYPRWLRSFAYFDFVFLPSFGWLSSFEVMCNGMRYACPTDEQRRRASGTASKMIAEHCCSVNRSSCLSCATSFCVSDGPSAVATMLNAAETVFYGCGIVRCLLT